jgi:type IV secretion system protein VirD4
MKMIGTVLMTLTQICYFADREFDGLYLSPDAQPTNSKSEPATLNA